MKKYFAALLILALLIFAGCTSRQIDASGASQTPPTTKQNAAAPTPATSATPDADVRVYRGSLNDRALEMRLKREGEGVSGFYDYDGIGQDIGLEGRAAGKEKFELAEKDAGGRVTGRWACEVEKQGEWDQDLSCKWTKPDGKGEMFVALYEQAAFASQWRVAPKTIENRKVGARASYPQIMAASGAQLSPAATHFNQLLEKKVGKQVRDFAAGMEGEKNLYFHTDYNTLFASDDLISVEIAYDSYAGGAHPESSYDAVTYDLRADRELKIEDLFKPRSGYAQAIGDYCLKDINRRAEGMEDEIAKRQGTKPEPPVDAAQLEHADAFGLTSKGLMIYYDLPHVIAVFDRNFVPYAVVKNYVKPDSRVASLAK